MWLWILKLNFNFELLSPEELKAPDLISMSVPMGNSWFEQRDVVLVKMNKRMWICKKDFTVIHPRKEISQKEHKLVKIEKHGVAEKDQPSFDKEKRWLSNTSTPIGVSVKILF